VYAPETGMISPSDLRPGSPVQSFGVEDVEPWLVERIGEDPTILGVGDVDLMRASWRSRQVSLLWEDPAKSDLYVVELQLGPADDRHIIRLAEHWDATRKRYGRNRCFAVLVAEQIAPRYLNILQVINKVVPVTLMELRVSEAAGTITLASVPVGSQLR
jgi:hypothetical protein